MNKELSVLVILKPLGKGTTMYHQKIIWSMIVAFLLILSGCEGRNESEKHPPAPKTPTTAKKAEKLIAAHTSGVIPAKSAVRVRFLEDIQAGAALDQPLSESPFKFDPALEGTATWISADTLAFKPEEPMPSGGHYKVSLDLDAVLEEDQGSRPFTFEFDVITQSLEIHLPGLQAEEAGKGRRGMLQGRLVLADEAQPEQVKMVLHATQEKRRLPVDWTRGDSLHEFVFTITGIERGDLQSHVEVSWDGSALGADQKGSRRIAVPPAHAFSVIQARSEREHRNSIEVRFSDPLDPEQDLAGLIRAEKMEDLRFSIDRAIVRVYSQADWPRQIKLRVLPGIKNTRGDRISKETSFDVFFQDTKPEVDFATKGVILPTSADLTLPVEAVNINAVKIRVIKIHETNIPQFLQVNAIDGDRELKRVGRPVWEEVLPLADPAPILNERQRFGLDLRPLLERHSTGMFRIELSFDRRHILYPCRTEPFGDTAKDVSEDRENWDSEDQPSYWNDYENLGGYTRYQCWQERFNPCHPGYYLEFHDHKVTRARNILISDMGLIAKRGEGDQMVVFVTDLKTAHPLEGAEVRVLDYQKQTLASARTDAAGRVSLSPAGRPYMLIAQKDSQKGYLRLNDGSALSVSHFDVSGQAVKHGLKGFFYGERGVWRPGDPIHMTFILVDQQDRLPEDHPIRFEFLNPKGQLIKTVKQTKGQNGFHCLTLSTAEDAPTGTWNVIARVGGTEFQKPVRIDTIMPNRLKIDLDFGAGQETLSPGSLRGSLTATWLHGAKARDLDAKVDLTFTPRKTVFPAYNDYNFDDPVRIYRPETLKVFDGTLNREGQGLIKANLKTENLSPGMLTAVFKSRVFEPGGAFSLDQLTLPFHPYRRYLGIALPEGDEARGMLLTDTTHKARIVMLTPEGRPVQNARAEVSLYKIKWRWWWEKGSENLAGYLGRHDYRPVKTEEIEIRDGLCEWPFEIKYPSWGRYLIRVKDLGGEHITGKAFYLDWPGWAGKARKEAPGGASVLNFSTDKESYFVGETVRVTIPEVKQGRGLLSIENGAGVIRTAWVEPENGRMSYEFAATPEMTPNIYLHMTLIQPHAQSANDLPIRMYGIVSAGIEDPGTRLEPVVECEDVFRPEEEALVRVSEKTGRAMTYTLAVVDEGLLDLTRFRTPDPWDHFYHREKLGVKTWDVYDDVVGAYGIELERLLAIGGGEGAVARGEKKANRFPPMVVFLGPFNLAAEQTAEHSLKIPRYVGSVRVMVVAGDSKAFGSTDKAVFVRKPIMVLGTLPRFLGPGEKVRLPVSVFSMEENIRGVHVRIAAQGPVSLDGPHEKTVAFTEPGDELLEFGLAAGPREGIARIDILAAGGDETARHSIELDVRSPMQAVSDFTDFTLEPGQSETRDVAFPGASGTNEVFLEVSRLPPLNLTKRLDYLVKYPHGCVEQITSAAFPQLFLDRLLSLSPEKQEKIQSHVESAISRLKTFQTVDGGFGYWPGDNRDHGWATSYAGNFLLEAKQVGYFVEPHVLKQWESRQKQKARSWTTGGTRSELEQAYRLYTLSLAGEPELSAMNRLRESLDLPTAARWRLAAAYQLAGQPEAAEALVEKASREVPPYRELSNTFGTDLRDKAMIMETLALMEKVDEAGGLLLEISKSLASSKALSTQTTACCLAAAARLAGFTGQDMEISVDYSWNGETRIKEASVDPVIRIPLDTGDRTGGSLEISNENTFTLYPQLVSTGVPEIGTETASANGLDLKIAYGDGKGKALDPSRLEQGRDFTVTVSVTNTGNSGMYEELALSYLLPSGWEILNANENPGEEAGPDPFEFQDVRDDRIFTYFDLDQGGTRTFKFLLNASYLGEFYLPMSFVEAMYDAQINARVPGRWVRVVKPGT